MKARRLGRVLLTAALLLLLPAAARAQELQVDWKPGPATVTLGDGVAEVAIDDGYIFAGPDDTRKVMEYLGNVPQKNEAGLIAPKAEGKGWFVVFKYNPIGFVPDTDRDKIDADAILAAVKKGTEQANEVRRKKGESTLTVLGWHEPPRYDPASHNLVWALLAEDSAGGKVVNHNTRLLGRYGYMSTVLVASPEEMERSKPELERILASFRYTKGKSYLEYVKGDPVAKYGLTALLAGGAGAAAAKLGLFAYLGKFIKPILLGIAAAFAAFANRIKALFGRRPPAPESAPPPPEPPPAA